MQANVSEHLYFRHNLPICKFLANSYNMLTLNSLNMLIKTCRKHFITIYVFD